MNAAKLLGSLLGSNSMKSNILGQLLKGGGGGGMAGALGGLLGSGKSSGLGSILGGLMGGGKAAAGQSQATALAEAPTEVTGNEAEILLRAMCNAAKSDGHFDDKEKEAILSRLDDAGQDEIEFLRKELSQPLDVQAFAAEVPAPLAEQTYAVSVMAIKVDEQSEAQYLGQLAKGLQLDPTTCNHIHQQLGAPQIFQA